MKVSSRCWSGMCQRVIGDLHQFPKHVSAVEWRGVGWVIGWVDKHGRLKAVEAAGQRRTGQIGRQWFAYTEGSLHAAKRHASAVTELAAGCDSGREVEGTSPQCARSADAQAEADGGWLTGGPGVGSLALVDKGEFLDAQGGGDQA